MSPELLSAGPVFRVQVAERVQAVGEDVPVLIKGLLDDVFRDRLAQKQVVVSHLDNVEYPALDVDWAFRDEWGPDLFCRKRRQPELSELVHLAARHAPAAIHDLDHASSWQVDDILARGAYQLMRVAWLRDGNPEDDGVADADVEHLAQGDDVGFAILAH